MRPTDLRGILQYVPQFRDRTFVIAVDGAVITDDNFPNLLLDIAVLRSLNIHVVLVHGAAAQIEALAREQQIQPSNLDGDGVTDAATLRLALTASNRLTHEILEGLAATDLRAACPNAIVAYPAGILHGVDRLYTGKVERVDVQLLETLIQHGIVPVVPPLGFDGEGHTYRLNSDSVAVAVATALKAVKLIFVTTRDALEHNGKPIRHIMVADLEQLLAQQPDGFPRELLSKARHAAAACRAGVHRVHIINGRINEGLLAEVFSNEGVGTLVYADEYQQIRRALKKDARTIYALIQQAVATEELMRRTRAGIERQIGDYYLFEIDRNPVACVALHPYPEEAKGEVACLYVKPSHENQGIGRKLLQFVENRAREMGLRTLFALSTQTFMYFQTKAGFVEGSPEDLPPARREKYEQSGRRSKILIKHL
ncbi:amino-acid N-acetyltransferase [Limisphaera sp. 4302-co]|uniref:amino-acid N-acetyltransferase n=1 Tax=Limisphaera sp. 4302-co TaxID=3400417 RepID=UPI003C1B7F0C